jgi:FecR-like protein
MDFGLCRRFFVVSIGLYSLGIGRDAVWAAQKEEARITQIIKDAQLLGANNVPRSAAVNDNVSEGIRIRTGPEARLELTFNNKTVVRLGANAVFSFKNGTRTLNLGDGALLLQVPKSAKGATICSEGIAATLTGTTAVFEYHSTHYKFLVLDGTGRLYRPGHLGDSVLVNAGQMVFGQPKTALSDPVDFDIGRFVKTSRFIMDFRPLGSETLMAKESQKQQREKSKKTLIDTNLVILGGGTAVSIVDPAQVQAIDRGRPAPATPISSAAQASADLGTIETSSRPGPSPTPASEAQ